MGKHSDLKIYSTGRVEQPHSGKHQLGIGMIPVGDRERGDPKKDTAEERYFNNDPHVR